MKDWKEIEKESKLRKSLRSRFTLLGRKVRRFGEEGIIVISTMQPKLKYRKDTKPDPEYFIMFKEDDLEQLIGLPFKIWDDESNRFIDDSPELTHAFTKFELTDEEIEFLGLNDIDKIVKKI